MVISMRQRVTLEMHRLMLRTPRRDTICYSFGEPSRPEVVSVPSLLDPSLAPPGYHVLHAYTAGNEPYEVWEKSRGRALPLWIREP